MRRLALSLKFIFLLTALGSTLPTLFAAEQIERFVIRKVYGRAKLNGSKAIENTKFTVGDTLEVSKGSSFVDISYHDHLMRLVAGKISLEKNFTKQQGHRVRINLNQGEFYFWFNNPPDKENLRISAGKVDLVFAHRNKDAKKAGKSKLDKPMLKEGEKSISSQSELVESQFMLLHQGDTVSIFALKGQVAVQKKINKTKGGILTEKSMVTLSAKSPNFEQKPLAEKYQSKMQDAFSELESLQTKNAQK